MAEFRGRHFGFLTLLCATWIATRIGFLTFAPDVAADVSEVQEARPRTVSAPGSTYAVSPVEIISLQPNSAAPGYRRSVLPDGPPSVGLAQISGKPARLPPRTASAAPPLQPFVPVSSAVGPALVLQPPATPERRLQLYAYSFWRSGSPGPALVSGGQYGGSQSGFVATYALSRRANAEQKLAVLLRGAVAHEDSRERELAAGVRLRPSEKLPVTLTGERRFRANRPDAFAAYVAGGVSDVRLPLRFRLESYAQGGVVSGKDGGAFFDFLARADRKIMATGNAKLSAGAGAWGGGQDNVRRFDIGPTVRGDLALGGANFRVSADWRFRVAGTAKPANGPAITLSTSF